MSIVSYRLRIAAASTVCSDYSSAKATAAAAATAAVI